MTARHAARLIPPICTSDATENTGRFKLDPSRLFHMGIVVNSIEQTRDSISLATGERFLPITHSKREVITPQGSVPIHFTVSFSAGRVRLELIEEVPGTIWIAAEGLQVHHLGYWASNLSADSESLEAAGAPVAAYTERWAYHRFADHYIELLDEKVRPDLEERWRQVDQGD
jgi:Glyoxalase/Bleomycin resistance protein/Dioxygenase superfamily